MERIHRGLQILDLKAAYKRGTAHVLYGPKRGSLDLPGGRYKKGRLGLTFSSSKSCSTWNDLAKKVMNFPPLEECELILVST